MEQCSICDKPTAATCPDGACKECHVSVSWEDCTDGSYSAEASRRLGYSEERLREMYPKSNLRRVEL